jgi:hypothetical protein
MLSDLLSSENLLTYLPSENTNIFGPYYKKIRSELTKFMCENDWAVDVVLDTFNNQSITSKTKFKFSGQY